MPDTKTIVGGGELRDAAVDPRPEDYLAPINAGKADPHGPEVVAPGIHAVGPVPLVPGEVGPEGGLDDDGKPVDVDQDKANVAQEKRELAAAKAALLEGDRPSDQHKAAAAAGRG